VRETPVVATVPPVATTTGTAEQHHQRGRDLIQQKKYREAIEELSEALRQQPDLALAYNARGYAYSLLRDFPHAIADYDAAIRINPKYVNAYQNRRAARSSSGDKAGAAADAEKLRELGK
jgi:tetratricopeptide (TPR) repeat protein